MKNQKNILVLLLTLCFLGACSSEDMIEPPAQTSGQLLLSLSLPNVGISRSVSEPGEDLLNENVIDKADFFFYRGDVLVWHVPENSFIMTHSTTHKGKELRINVSDNMALQLKNRSFEFVAIINGPARSEIESLSLSQLKQYIVKTNSLNGASVQPSFLMEGSKSTGNIIFDSNKSYDLGTLSLTRVAAKIRLKLLLLGIDGYTLGKPRAMLSNYLEHTRLMASANFLNESQFEHDFKQTTYSTLKEVSIAGQHFYTTEIPYYSYENSWLKVDSRESFILIELPLTASNITRNYYYRVPINYRLGEEGTRVLRNHLYEITASIAEVGSESGDLPINLEGEVTATPWGVVDEIQAYLSQENFLIVKEPSVVMANINKRMIEYLSSSEVSIYGDIKATFIGYDVDGKVVHGSQLRPPIVTFEVKDKLNYIVVTNPIPQNYVPVNIEFTVENKTGLQQIIEITQYPPRYITAERSVDKNDRNNYYLGSETGPDSHHNNLNLFKVTTLVAEMNDIIGDPVDNKGMTKEDSASNRLISPQFIIASQLGVTLLRYFNLLLPPNYGEHAQLRCTKYFEKDYGPNRKVNGKWRLPTRAEIEYIEVLQRDPSSAVKELLKGERYWSGQPYYYYNFNLQKWLTRVVTTQGKETIYNDKATDATNEAHIRCVFDIYKYE